MVLQHEHQHDETMLATHQLRGLDATPPPAGPPDRRRGPRRRRRRGDRADIPRRPARPMQPIDGGPFAMGTSTEPWAYDNERRAHLVDAGRLPDRHDAGHQPRLPRVHRRRRLRRRAPVDSRPAGPGASTQELAHPQFWQRQGDGGVERAALRPTARPRGAPRRAGPARVLVRGRRLRPVGGQAAAHRGRVGEGRGRADRRPDPTPTALAGPGATTRPTRPAPTSARRRDGPAPGHGPTRPAPARGVPRP